MPEPTLSDVISKLDNITEKLWGKNGFKGDIVEIQERLEQGDTYFQKLLECAQENKGNIKVLQETKLGWRDWKFIVLIVLAVLGSGGAGAGIVELIK